MCLDITEHKAFLHSVCRQFSWAIGPNIEYQDLFQEASLAAFRCASGYDEAKGAATTFLKTCVHRRLMDYTLRQRDTMRAPPRVQKMLHKAGETSRMRRVLPTMAQLEAGQDLADVDDSESNESAVDCIEEHEQFNDLHMLLEQLNPRERIIVHRIVYGDETHAQVAESLGISRQYVTSMLRGALAKLKTAAVEQGIN